MKYFGKMKKYGLTLFVSLFLLSFSAARAQYVINIEFDPHSGAGYVTGLEASYAANAVAEITAYDNSGFEFDHWENEDGDVIGNNRVLRYTVTSSCDIYAVYSIREVKWNLTASILPAGADTICSVTGTGEKTQGSNATLHASYTSPYTFDHWEVDGVNVATTSDYFVGNIRSNIHAVAIFTYLPQDRTISVASNDLSRGTVEIKDKHNTTSTSSLTITERDQLTLTATPTGSEYRFAGWFLGDELVSADAVYTFTLPDGAGNRTYTANFVNASDSYTMTAVYDPPEAASTKVPNTSTSIQVGNAFTYNTAAAANWVFDGWYDESENLVSSTNSYTISYVIRDRTLKARFHHEPYTIAATVNPAAAGSVNITGANNAGTYDAGSSPVLNAVANSGYRFVNWTGDFSSTNNPYTINSISRNYSNIVANFIATHTITLTNATLTSASTQPVNGRYDEGTTFTVTANNRANFVFSHWTVNGVEDPSANVNPYSGTLTADITLEPVYTPVYSVALYKNPANAVVTLTGAGNYQNGESVTVEASYDNNAYTFLRWTIAGTNTEVSTQNPYTFTISGNTELTAQMEPLTRYYSVTTSIEGNGSIRSDQLSVIPGTTTGIAEGSTVVINYDEVPGWRFQKWVVNGVDNTNTTCRIENISSDVTVQAVFRESTLHRLTVNTNPANDPNIHVEPANVPTEYADGDQVTLYAHAGTNPNYTFVAWMSGNTILSINPSLTLTMTSDTTVTACFFVAENPDMQDYLTYDDDVLRTTVTGVIEAYRNRITTVTIPSTVTAIANAAFRNCTSLTDITIPAGVASIGNYAFDGCTALTTVTLHDGITSLGNYAFNNCSALTTVTLPSGLTAIPEGLFYGCSSLTGVQFPAGVASIGSFAFNGCSSIYNLEVPASVTTVGAQAFAGMSGLHFVTLNAGNASFGNDCFQNSNNIVLTSFNGNLADWMTIDFANANAQPMSRSRNLSLNGNILTELVIPDGTVEVKPYAFFFDTLITNITIPASVTTIGSNAFYRLTHLQHIDLLGILATVDDAAFQSVSKEEVTVSVPCADYVEGMTWAGFTRISGGNMPMLNLVQRPGGMVAVTSAPTCNSLAYTYTIAATPGAYNVFQSWSDGNTDNPRTITLTTEDMTVSPIWGRSPSASEVMAEYFDFNSPEDNASWYTPSTGANQWVIGDASFFGRNGKGLYVSNDNGATNAYDAASDALIYTELKFAEGYYRIRFNYMVAGEREDFMSAGLFKEDGNYIDLEPHTPGVILVSDSLYGLDPTVDDWQYKERIIRIDEPGWYRLAFFWSVDDDDDIVAPAAAVDNVSITFEDERTLMDRTARVTVRSNNENMGTAYTNLSTTPDVHNTTDRYYYGEVAEIHAVSNNPQLYRFVRWSDGDTRADRSFEFLDILGVNPDLTAIFEPVPTHYTVTVDIEASAIDGALQFGVVNGTEISNGSTSIPVEQDAVVVLNQPQAGWAFMGWWDGNAVISTDNPFTYTGRTDITLTALMKPWRDCSDDDDVPNFSPMPGNFTHYTPEIDDVIVDNVEVEIVNGLIAVSNTANIEVLLFDVNGRVIDRKNGNGNTIYFEVPVSGSYMLRVGNLLTKKVVVIR